MLGLGVYLLMCCLSSSIYHQKGQATSREMNVPSRVDGEAAFSAYSNSLPALNCQFYGLHHNLASVNGSSRNSIRDFWPSNPATMQQKLNSTVYGSLKLWGLVDGQGHNCLLLIFYLTKHPNFSKWVTRHLKKQANKNQKEFKVKWGK